MTTAKFAIAALCAAAAITPSISSASPEKASLDACTRAFAATLAAHGGEAPKYRVVYLDDQVASTLAWYNASEYTYRLEATDPKSGAAVARATCLASAGGVVKQMRID
jgi:hypothetical protein